MEHHVDVIVRQAPALLKHARLFSQDIEIEPQSIPGYDCISALNPFFQIVDQPLNFVPAHSLCRVFAVSTAVPEQRLTSATQKGCTAGNPQGTRQPPVVIICWSRFCSLYIECQMLPAPTFLGKVAPQHLCLQG
jgi:hypothetical protein